MLLIKHLQSLFEVTVPNKITSKKQMQPPVSGNAPEFVKEVTARIIAGEGDLLPVSKMPVDGTFPANNNQMGKKKYCSRCSCLGYGNLYSM